MKSEDRKRKNVLKMRVATSSTPKLMHWMKSAQGKTLEDAIEQWISIPNEMRTEKRDKQIALQFEYDTYIRNLINDKPDKNIELFSFQRSCLE